MNAECRYASALFKMLWILVSSTVSSLKFTPFKMWSSSDMQDAAESAEADERAGCQFVSASSIAIELFSSSVRRTVASFVRPAMTAASS